MPLFNFLGDLEQHLFIVFEVRRLEILLIVLTVRDEEHETNFGAEASLNLHVFHFVLQCHGNQGFVEPRNPRVSEHVTGTVAHRDVERGQTHEHVLSQLREGRRDLELVQT